LFGELLATAVLEPVPHRHVVFTIPKALRGLFVRERRLLSLLSRCAHDCVQRAARAHFDDPSLSVGTVAALQTFGSYAANFHPHVHAIVTDGAFASDGRFERMGAWDAAALTELFRRLVLAALRREQRLLFDLPRSVWVERLWRSIEPPARCQIVSLLAEMGRRALAARTRATDQEARDES
jgi:hypothetical protein